VPDPRVKPEIKHTVIHADRKSDVKIDGKANPVLKDWTVFITADAGGNLSQQVVCRPIGNVPGTTDASYVKIQSDHVTSYATGLLNPLEAGAKMELAKARDKFYVTLGLYVEKEGILLWGDTPVANLWRDAKKEADAVLKAAKAAYYTAEESAGRFPAGHSKNPGNAKDKVAPPFPGKIKPINDYLPDKFREDVAKAELNWKKSDEHAKAEAACKKATDQYETKGGPDGTTPQQHITWLEGVPPRLVKQYLSRMLTDPTGTIEDITNLYGARPLAK
jgi:hypothetical protein